MVFCTIVIRWAPEVQNIFYQGNKRRLVPSSQNRRKLEHFFNCASTMMCQQLQSLSLDSVSNFIELLIRPPVMFTHCCMLLMLLHCELFHSFPHISMLPFVSPIIF